MTNNVHETHAIGSETHLTALISKC